MGKTRNLDLTDYYLRAAGIAAIWIDAAGHIGAQDVAKVEHDPRRIVYCCARGEHFRLSFHLYEWKLAVQASPEAIARKLEEMAADLGIGLVKHVTAIDRANAAVAAVNSAIDAMKASGDLLEFNAAFKAARAVEPTLRYATFMEAKKAGMLQELAKRSNGSTS